MLIQASFPYLWQKKNPPLYQTSGSPISVKKIILGRKINTRGIIRYAFKIMNMTGDYFCSVIGSLLCIYEALACPSTLKQKNPKLCNQIT